ncbi:hypothetical protein PsorP6_000376 [Peronosclerospora sorghi]|uniref:Uncharacterized protein n=1 Tax=Peronosclerospora sorghi TaxID=230839 RepID=A0ACC0WXN4_9STRA|nr:hypothetical protein PsorP6_000376 [Peronosclerospora sorghi]
MATTKAECTTRCTEQTNSFSCRFGAIVGLQFFTEAAFGFMSPIISIVMTEYFARQHREGIPIDCGAKPHDKACVEGSRQAAWLSSLFSALGCASNFILAPILGQASDLYGRKVGPYVKSSVWDPFLVLSQLARVGTPFSVQYFMQPNGSITPYFILRLIDYGFGTYGVMSAAVADVVTPENRAAAFGILFASLSHQRVSSTILLSSEWKKLRQHLCPEEHILNISAALFISRVLWAMIVLPETLPLETRANKTRWVMESPMSSMSILFRNKLFMRLTCLIALTTFVMNGIFQIQSFYLNTVLGFNVNDFGNVMLLGGVISLLGQCLLLKPLVSCFKEKGVIVMAAVANLLKTVGFAGSAFYPHKWVIYVLCVPASLSDLSFPAIAALKSINVSEKEQGRLQGAIYGARAVFDALGPVMFSFFYAAMTRPTVWSQAFPYLVAAFLYLVGIGVALSLPTRKPASSNQHISVAATLPSPTCGNSPSSFSVYFETDDEEADEAEFFPNGAYFDMNEDYLSEPLLKNRSMSAHEV